jgi:hypothetical protein
VVKKAGAMTLVEVRVLELADDLKQSSAEDIRAKWEAEYGRRLEKLGVEGEGDGIQG